MGLALFWKKPGIASQAFLGEIKKQLNLPGPARKGIGHNGTLDPFAEGLLLVAWEAGTKFLHAFQSLSKVYQVEMILGASSETLDPETEMEFPDRADSESVCERIRELATKDASFWQDFLTQKLGVQEQIPPRYSAVKIDGKVAYKLARKGQDFEIKARNVNIFECSHQKVELFQESGISLLRWKFSVRVSAGTYIRALARDWGAELCGFPGMLNTLTRTGMGAFSASKELCPKLLGVDDLKKHFNIRYVSVDVGLALKNGQRLPLTPAPDSDQLIYEPSLGLSLIHI